MLDIYVGVPEDDELVTVPKDWTIAKVLSENNVRTEGMVQFNGRTIPTNEFDKTLESLGATDHDQLYVVRKLDSA